MATPAPVGTGGGGSEPVAAPAAPAAPAAQPQAPAAEPEFDLSGAIHAAIIEPSRSPAPPAGGQPGQGTPPTPADPLAAIVPGLPPEAQAAIQQLRTNAGRAAAAQRELAELRARQAEPQQGDQQQRLAEWMLVREARQRPEQIAELAAMAGVDPRELAQAAMIDQAPATDWRQVADPQLGAKIYDEFRRQASPTHERSWTKPIMEIQQQAFAARSRAAELMAEARLAENPLQAQRLQQEATSVQQQAEKLEYQALEANSKAQFGLMNALYLPLHERLASIEQLLDRVQRAEQSRAQARDQINSLQRQAAAMIGENGAPLFGPAGYGIFDVDQAGNVSGLSKEGKTLWPAVQGVMAEYGLPADINGLVKALHLLALEAPASDGAPASAAGATPDGGNAPLVPGAPAAAASHPSLVGAGSPAPRY